MTLIITECPFCGKELETQLQEEHYEGVHDYKNDFTTECDHCEKTIQVDVEPMPYFSATKPKEAHGITQSTDSN